MIKILYFYQTETDTSADDVIVPETSTGRVAPPKVK